MSKYFTPEQEKNITIEVRKIIEEYCLLLEQFKARELLPSKLTALGLDRFADFIDGFHRHAREALEDLQRNKEYYCAVDFDAVDTDKL